MLFRVNLGEKASRSFCVSGFVSEIIESEELWSTLIFLELVFVNANIQCQFYDNCLCIAYLIELQTQKKEP